MTKYQMFDIYASEDGIYFSSTDEATQKIATELFFQQSNQVTPDFKIPSWPKSSKVLGLLQQLKSTLCTAGWEPYAVTQEGKDLNYFFRREVAE